MAQTTSLPPARNHGGQSQHELVASIEHTVESFQGGGWPWGARARLARAAKAVRAGDYATAAKRYASAWKRLTASPKSRDALLATTAVGLALVEHRQGDHDAVIAICRDGQHRGVGTDSLVDLACVAQIQRRRIATADDAQDVLTWLARRGGRAPAGFEQEIESVLLELARPWRRTGKEIGVLGELLRRLSDVRPQWRWVDLHLAEWARRERRFAEAAVALARLRGKGGTSEDPRGLAWGEAECRFLSGDKQKTEDACAVAWAMGPRQEADALLAVEASTQLGMADVTMARLRTAMRQFGPSTGVCTAARRVGVSLGCWPGLRSLVDEASLPGRGLSVAAFRLVMDVAVASHDAALAQQAVAAASALSLAGGDADLAVLFGAPAGNSPSVRSRLVAYALGAGTSGPIDASGVVPPSTKSTWTRLAAGVEFHQMLASRRFAEAATLAPKIMGVAEWRDSMEPLVAGGAVRAFRAEQLAPAVELAEQSANPRLRTWLGEAMLSQVATAWNSGEGRAKLRAVATALGAVQRLVPSAGPEVSAFMASVVAMAAREAGTPVPPLAGQRGLVPACLARLAGEKAAAEQACQALKGSPRTDALAIWLEQATARDLLQRGDWAAAFDLCGVAKNQSARLLERLRVTGPACRLASAFDLAADGRFEEAFDLGLDVLKANPSSEILTATAELAVALRRARGEAGLRERQARWREAMAAVKGGPAEKGAALPWATLALAGLWSKAADALLAKAVPDGITWDEIASLAVIAAAAARETASPTTKKQAFAYLAASVGAFAALTLDERAMLARCAVRIRSYGTDSLSPSLETLRRGIEEQAHVVLASPAATCGITPEQLDMLFAIERTGGEAMLKARPAMASSGGDKWPAGGPLLLAALGFRTSVMAVFREFDSKTGAGGGDLRDLTEYLEQIGLPVGALGLSTAGAWQIDPAILRADRLCSPLAPLVVLAARKGFGTALPILKSVIVEESLRPVFALVSDLAITEITAYVSREREKSFLDRARRLLVEVAIEESRDLIAMPDPDVAALRTRLREILEMGRAVGRADELADSMASLFVGRAAELMKTRTREERIKGDDRRSNDVRAQEALVVCRAGLEVFADGHGKAAGIVAAQLAMGTNILAVKAANAKDYLRAETLLLDALAVNPANRKVSDNLIQVIMMSGAATLPNPPDPSKPDAPGLDTAFEKLMASRRRLLALQARLCHSWTESTQAGQHQQIPEVTRAIDELGKKASTPFFNASIDAQRQGRWDLAAKRMIQASLAGPRDTDTEQGLAELGLKLRREGRTREFQEMKLHVTEERQGASADAKCLRLKQEAETLGARGDYREALRRLAAAEGVIPELPVVARLRRGFAERWLERAKRDNDPTGIAEAELALGPSAGGTTTIRSVA